MDGTLHYFIVVLSILFTVVPVTEASTQGGSKKCVGNYQSPVVNLCTAHWPDAKAEKVWMVLFYAPWCGHCRAIEPKYAELAKQVRQEKGIGIGAIDCNEGTNQGLCSKFGVSGYPTLKAIVAGKPKSYNGPRETQPMKEWITGVLQKKGTKGGSAKCPVGIFKSKVKDSPVPLCEAHFPSAEAKNSWMVVLYNEKEGAAGDFKDTMNRVALDLGNEPPDKSKALKKLKKQRERLTSLSEKYEIKVSLPKKGPFGMDALIKVGALCCDCQGEESQQFCYDLLGAHGNASRPIATWVAKGETEVREGSVDATSLIAFALEKLGFYKPGAHAKDGEL